MMRLEDIRKVLVVGAGTMGGQIALQCAWHGYEVNLFDSEDAVLLTVNERLRAYADALIAGDRLTEGDAHF